MTTREKLAALRRLMDERGLAAYIVPSTDPHQNEYVPPCWRRRAWLSGFTGSAGEVIVTRTDAGLWTDGRYFLQAAAQLKGSGIRLYKMGEPGVATVPEYLSKALRSGDVLGVDPQVISVAAAAELEKAVAAAGASCRWLEENLVDRLWTDRPDPSLDPVKILPDKFAGETVASKLRRVRKEMKEKGAEAHVLASLDSIAWLYNIRGQDAEYNPVVISYAMVTPTEAFLHVRPEKVSEDVARKLGAHVKLRPYESIREDLVALAAGKARVWVDRGAASRWMLDLLDGCTIVGDRSPISLMKAKKNETEIAGMRAAHVRDGVALARFLHWLDNSIASEALSEISAATKLEQFRAEGEYFQGISFDTISGYGPHGAIVHYSVTEETDVPLHPEGLYLIDSGGQYLDGTTDITRTVLLGRTATREQKERFTRVLKGHIALARVKFPAGVRGIRLDVLARVPLWDAGLDYNHGTGHGVGMYLCVHEGPQSISPTRDTGAALEPGNILSNEPGYYEAGAYGIRTENLVLVVEDKPKSAGRRATGAGGGVKAAGGAAGAGSGFLRFDTISLCPIDLRLVEPKLLTPEERAWLNDYHKTVYKALSPHMTAAEKQWLKRACAAV
jgi:Xaa-Pro aminopeptidase